MSFLLHHTGVVVSDLDRSIAFYRRHFEAELVHRVDGAGGLPEVAALHGLQEADFDLAHLRVAGGLLELVQYRWPPGAVTAGAGSDLGATHIAFQTDDIAGVHSRLTAEAVAFYSRPLTLPDGTQLAFCLDPDGNEIELMQPPGAESA